MSTLKELFLTSKEAYIVRRIIKAFKIPPYTVGCALCYYQDISIDSFNMFCLCLLVAHKVYEDYKIRTKSWSRYVNIDKSWLIVNEIRLLKFYNHQMYLPKERVLAATVNCLSAFFPSK
eukprot:NODE_497_length_6803_cov_1.267900.p5 type:complete len:119 gc:universal NODE_497_length_6803_cov_1.267900:4753-5109(+)